MARPKGSRHLTEHQIWTLLHAPDATDEALAAATGAKVSTVHNARWKLRKAPWTCSVRYRTCRHCGEPATFRGQSTLHAYHTGCRAEARKAVQQRLDEERPVTPQMINKLHQWAAEAQERTLATATRSWARWTQDEDDFVIAMADRPLEESAQELGRTLLAVDARRVVLRKRGRLL